MKSLAPNTLVQNRYLVVQLIGKGGMGEVYLAVDQRLGSAVALKRMLFTDEEALGAAFEREAKTLARLRHPALTKVSDHFTENGMQYLVMEHISGDDLSKRLEQNAKPFPLSWVLFWADQLLDALNYLHSHEPPIIHRDIKPQNLKLTDDNHIILLDFGLAKDSVGETRLSTTGNVIAYTPNYASMEQIRGTGTNARSDIYALSATMYQLLSHVVPADALSRADSVLNGLPDPVDPLHQLNSEVSPAISDIIIKGMSLSAEQRFANSKEMQIALREAYAQFQQGMSAATVAFNVADEPQIASSGSPQANLPTEQFSVPNVSLPVGAQTEVMPVTAVVRETSENIAVPEISEKPVNFDATIPYGMPISGNLNDLPPIGAQTEVMPDEFSDSYGDKTQVSPIDYNFPVGENTDVFPDNFSVPTGEKTEVIETDYSAPITDYSVPVNEKTESFSFNDSAPVGEQTAFFSADATAQNVSAFDDVPRNGEDSYKADEPYSAEMTVPLVNYGAEVSPPPSNETSNFIAVPPTEVEEKPVVAEVKPEPKKAAAAAGGGSKALVIVGVLAILAFLGIGAAGAGAYYFMPELFGSVATPTPTTQPSIEPTNQPTLAPPTPEPTLQAETNTNTGNSTVDLTNSNNRTNQTDVAVDKTPRPEVEKTQQPTQQPTRQPTGQPTAQPTKPNTQPTKPQPTRTPPPKPIAKPTVDPGKIQ
jgi:serine/threonine protein kinase